ncbi:MAG TPA: hypothetical protein VLF93_04540 [Candidatus Saccharimonadales bacterium]|nr:hypothetical protein [Candidatus Saccharimonadales bacterium]
MHEARVGISAAETLLRDGITAKERKDFRTAAGLFTDAIIKSQELNYPHGVLHGLINIGTIWKLKAREKGSDDFARMARLSFAEAVDYARTRQMPKEEVIHATFLLGQAEVEVGNVSEAISLYQETYDYYREHPRSHAHTGDVQRHLGTALVKAGDVEEGIAMIEEGLSAIRTFDEIEAFDKRNYVWETGALLALSDAYSENDQEKARQLAQEALTIATERELVIRKEEAQKMINKLHTS